ncbi:MAG: RIP metalloprotease RseP [Thioalkalispiraceae bacterium]|jgi:regulator of sigma E protease
MLDMLQTILSFIVAISILIAVHEFGHFWVARKMGVKVLRYSIGFGKPLWSKKSGPDQTEYVIASIPLGGYVKMLDEREGEVEEHERHRAFNNQTVGKRFAIVFAGPAFNFIFAVFAYWLMFVIGVTGFKPVVGEVTANTPAAYAGFESGEQIVAVNDKSTPIWDVAMQSFLPAMIKQQKVDVIVSTEYGQRISRNLDFTVISDEFEPEAFFDTIGLYPWRPDIKATVGQVLENSPASLAGLQRGDHIISIDEQKIKDWYELVEYVSARPNSKIQLLIERNGNRMSKSLLTGQATVKNKTVGRIGIGPYEIGKYPEEMKVHHQYGVLESVSQSMVNTWDKTTLMLNMLWKIVVGEASLKNLSGPINIAVYAGQSASAGMARFLDFLAIVSISLGVLNLLPVPILDGGHLMYYVVEIVKGRPVSERTQELGQRIGIVLLLMLMSLAFYNDIVRLLNN